MIIDIHVHPLEVGLPSIPRQIETFQLFAKRTGISRFCLMGHVCAAGYTPTRTEIISLNDQTLAFVEARPDLFSGFCYLNPAHPEGFLQREFDRCVLQGPLRGVKLWVSVNVTDERAGCVFTMAQEARVPILHHAWYKTVGRVACESTPADIAEAAARFPDVTLIMAHLTGAGVRGILDVAPCPNVFVDTSGSQPVAGMMEYAVDVLGAHRVLFGSDASGRDFAVQLARVKAARIPSRAQALILGENARRLLRLTAPGEEVPE